MDCDCFIMSVDLLASHYLFEVPPDVCHRKILAVSLVNFLKQLAKQLISSDYPVICPETAKMQPRKVEGVQNHQKVREKGQVKIMAQNQGRHQIIEHLESIIQNIRKCFTLFFYADF